MRRVGQDVIAPSPDRVLNALSFKVSALSAFDQDEILTVEDECEECKQDREQRR